MKKAHITLSVAAVSAMMLVGCGGNSSDADTATATFKDSIISELSYRCSSSDTVSKTNSAGEVTCNVGDTATFILGETTFGPVDIRQGDVITPYRIFPDNNEAAINLAQLLQSLDDDGSYDDVIVLDENKLGALTTDLDFTDSGFDNTANTLLQAHNISLVSEDDAKAHMNESISDTMRPVVTLKGDAEVEVSLGSLYVDAGATATDNIHGAMTATKTGSVNVNEVGTYTITYTATDAAGNTGTATRTIRVVATVVVVDTIAPTVTLNGDTTVHVGLNEAYTEAGATATDNVDGSITPVISGSVNTSVVGTYTITYTATDAAGNVGTVTRTVIVDSEATCQNVNPITGSCEDTVVPGNTTEPETTETTCQNVNPITGSCEDTVVTKPETTTEPETTEATCQNVNPITGSCED